MVWGIGGKGKGPHELEGRKRDMFPHTSCCEWSGKGGVLPSCGRVWGEGPLCVVSAKLDSLWWDS